ncbi:cytochrome P450 [Mycobacterium avium]|uniref:cytochrome P450 n=1 Tax=Mycobacterium avium TaxID=1764 RepID=UPI001CC5F9AB|nr:cytochrome P450 [Mycobacterium avium]
MTDSSLPALDPGMIECPFPAYKSLRDNAPVVELAAGIFFVTCFDDVVHILKDTDTFSSRAPLNPFSWFGPAENQDELDDILSDCPEIPTLLDNDPPEQTRVRGLVNKVFTAAKVKALEPQIAAVVDDLSAGWIGRGHVEFAGDFARLLPATVTAHALGADPSMRDKLLFWADEIMSRTAGPQSRQRQAEVARHIAEMSDYFLGLIRQRRADPRDDLISLLAKAELDGHRLTDVQIVNVAKTFLVGGNETTMFMLTSAWHRLATEPSVEKSLRDSPDLIAPFIEEILRLEAPAQGIPRFPTRDTEIRGTSIPKGSTVFLMYGSANHDESVFPEPEELVLDRRSRTGTKPHLAFGLGAHFCLGAQLARAEGRIALERLLPQMANIALSVDNPPQRNPNPMLRGFLRLDLTFGG